ncbi:uncharacterized protein L203_101049 [Cryptococcus depauperatus CBS 7841]|uniref:COX assembly mitochondrial protein n=1 Tax=Cryptococcus depauperatus CBS 7841 TaxID=1295531 RepID=A0AAJ8JP95_9TREE
MHPLLGNLQKQYACAEYIQALEECHAKGFLMRWSGGCNDHKKALTLCLRQERIERTTRNRESAKERTEKKKAAWAALEREKAEESV